MFTLQTLSIFLEAIIVLISLRIAISKKRMAGYGFALTFGIYVFYDAVRYYNYSINGELLQVLFFIATVSALLSIWLVYKRR
ncbi:MAG: hypothetical protein U9P50_01050 [Patescibacteria group bacterium]|nr:hypothetical protein [Patescibacteria group bacterium]